MRPLKQLEAAATSGPAVLPQASAHGDATISGQKEVPQFTPRADREDMELDTKLFTEPLPTNQQVD